MRHRAKLLVGATVRAVALSAATIAHAAEDAGAARDYTVPVLQSEGVAYHQPSRSYFTAAAFEGTLARGQGLGGTINDVALGPVEA